MGPRLVGALFRLIGAASILETHIPLIDGNFMSADLEGLAKAYRLGIIFPSKRIRDQYCQIIGPGIDGCHFQPWQDKVRFYTVPNRI